MKYGFHEKAALAFFVNAIAVNHRATAILACVRREQFRTNHDPQLRKRVEECVPQLACDSLATQLRRRHIYSSNRCSVLLDRTQPDARANRVEFRLVFFGKRAPCVTPVSAKTQL